MSKTLSVILAISILLMLYAYPRILEIYKPIDTNKINWNKIFDLKTLDKDYIAQGIEIYNNYLLYTVHKRDAESHLLVFEIKSNKNLKHLFTTSFPKVATHVSDLSIHNNFLYAIDYASYNLYKIDITKTLDAKTLIIERTIPTNLTNSGSIIVTNYNEKDIILISQFIVNKNIKAFYLDNLADKNKKPIFEIESKYYIQGLYADNNHIYITSNSYGVDPIFITKKSVLFNTKNLHNKSTISFNGPGKMIEDIVLYDDYIITSDEETNKIYISTEKIKNVLNEKE